MVGGNNLDWIVENKEWLFSGIGLTVFGAIGYLIKRKIGKDKINQTITSGDGSTNIQSDNDVNVTVGDKDARR